MKNMPYLNAKRTDLWNHPTWSDAYNLESIHIFSPWNKVHLFLFLSLYLIYILANSKRFPNYEKIAYFECKRDLENNVFGQFFKPSYRSNVHNFGSTLSFSTGWTALVSLFVYLSSLYFVKLKNIPFLSKICCIWMQKGLRNVFLSHRWFFNLSSESNAHNIGYIQFLSNGLSAFVFVFVSLSSLLLVT